MELSAKKTKKGCGLLWIGLAASLILLCCSAASILLWFNRTNIPIVAELFATSTPTPTPTPTATPTPLPIPGIDTPMTVEGIRFILTDAQFQDSYKSIDRTFRPNNAGETLLVLTGDVLSGGSTDIGKWKVEVKDENGESYVSGVKITTTTQGGKITFIWLIAVPEDAQELTLHLPDGQSINLMLLLEN